MAEDSVVLLKKQASILREYLARVGIDLKQRNALEAVALMHGAKDWNTLLAQQKKTQLTGRDDDRDPSAPASIAAFFDVHAVPAESLAGIADANHEGVIVWLAPLDPAAVVAGRKELQELLRSSGVKDASSTPERVCVAIEPALRALVQRFPGCLDVHVALARCLHGQRKSLAAAYYMERVFSALVALTTTFERALVPYARNRDLHELARDLVTFAQAAQVRDWSQRAMKYARLMVALWPQDDLGFKAVLSHSKAVEAHSNQQRIKQ